MREGRKWNVQISLLSQSIDDFDPVMIDFATAIFIMDAGPAQTMQKTCDTFGLSETAKTALRTQVHGPRHGGATFLAQFSTKMGINIQLLTLTLGPVELWAFSTTAEDASVRNQLYRHIGPSEARRFLAALFPNGTVTKELAERLKKMKSTGAFIEEEGQTSIVEELVKDILKTYSHNPHSKSLMLGTA